MKLAFPALSFGPGSIHDLIRYVVDLSRFFTDTSASLFETLNTTRVAPTITPA
jgi:hypothetical protein